MTYIMIFHFIIIFMVFHIIHDAALMPPFSFSCPPRFSPPDELPSELCLFIFRCHYLRRYYANIFLIIERAMPPLFYHYFHYYFISFSFCHADAYEYFILPFSCRHEAPRDNNIRHIIFAEAGCRCHQDMLRHMITCCQIYYSLLLPPPAAAAAVRQLTLPLLFAAAAAATLRAHTPPRARLMYAVLPPAQRPLPPPASCRRQLVRYCRFAAATLRRRCWLPGREMVNEREPELKN